MIKMSRFGTDFGYYCLNGDLLGLKFNTIRATIQMFASFAISDDFQHLASIEHIRIPKGY